MQTKIDNYEYVGDVNLEYGGAFIDMSRWRDGYATCIRITDLDSACGFDGAVMIEHLVIIRPDDRGKLATVLLCCGVSPGDLLRLDSDARRLAIAESCLGYGLYDPDDSWDGYRSYHTEIVQTQADGPMAFGGWKADKRVLLENLEGYVKAKHL